MAKKSKIGKLQNILTKVLIPVTAVGAFAGMVGYSCVAFADVIDGFFNPKLSFDNSAPVVVAAKQTAENLEGEGIVLMKNDGVLPITAANPKANVFGRFSVDPVYGGSGSGSGDAKDNVPLYGYKKISSSEYDLDDNGNPVVVSSLQDRGFTINPTLGKMYYNAITGNGGLTAVTKASIAMDNPANSHYEIGEVPVNDTYYSSDVKSSLTQYNDYSIVVLGRGGGEGGDLSADMSQWGGKEGEHQLQLNDDEKNMIALAKSTSKNVIVLINSSNAMELGDLANDEGINAIMWIGSTGSVGNNAVADALIGDINPSGRTVDTWASDFLAMPSAQNMGNNEYTENGEISTTTKTTTQGTKTWNNSSVDYEEGIYVGYKYYETRYETVVDGTNKGGTKSGSSWNYSDEVVYPYGYGLSYSNFEWSDYDFQLNGTTATVNVTVTNTTSVPGKDVVEIYYQSPYTDYDKANNVEKSSISLVGFAKTKTLRLNQSETVTIEFDLKDMASYDYTTAKSYILESGNNYYVSAGRNAHDALNNILEKKSTTSSAVEGNASFATQFSVNSGIDVSHSSETGEAIENKFDAGYSDKDSEGNNIVSYLTRADWEGTWPEARTASEKEITPAVKAGFAVASSIGEGNTIEEGITYNYPDSVTSTSLTVNDIIGKDFTDASWDTLLNQMSFDDMADLISYGRYQTTAIESIGLKQGIDYDGPASVNQNNISTGSGCYYPSEVVMASTWNTELCNEFGKAIGSESLTYGVGGWYAPAMNIHRTPWAGRNFEYYSEDGYLSGTIGSAVIQGANSMGVVTFTKHFAFNDQETNRVRKMAVWSNEQACREIYLKPFELAVTEGGSKTIMSSFSHIGTDWVGSHKGLMTDILRGEWGFKGYVLTDMYGGGVNYSYLDQDLGIRAGNDCWLESATNKNQPVIDNDTAKYYARQACKRIIYVKANSSLYYDDATKFALVDAYASSSEYSYYGLTYNEETKELENTTEKVSYQEYCYQYYNYRVNVVVDGVADSEVTLYNYYKAIHDAK
ncbi:MAG: glycoside hydrolase family 3 N-terminal domain-containing protein [Bacilli bacterium]